MSAGHAGETAWERHGSGPPIVLIHGFGLNRAMWQWTLPALTPHFSVLTYDLLGHGESAPPAGTPDLAMFSRQLLGLMDRCDIERVAVVGFSLGGMIARRIALDHADRLSALAILNSPHDRSPAAREAVRARVRQTEVHGPSANVEPAPRTLVLAGIPRRGAGAHRARPRLDRGQRLPPSIRQIYRVLAEGDAELVEGLERIACPTLVMTGNDDPGNTPAMARAMAGLIPGARLVILPGLRHMALAEAPGAVNTPICTFLRDATTRLQESVHGSGRVAPPGGRVVDLRAVGDDREDVALGPQIDVIAGLGRAVDEGPLCQTTFFIDRHSAKEVHVGHDVRPSPSRVPPGRSGSSRGIPARLPRRRAWRCWGRCSSRRWYRDGRRSRRRS